MARDRLAQLRAQRQAQGGAPQDVEMGNIRQPDYVTSPTNQSYGNGYGQTNGVDAMSAFYTEITSIQDSISQYNSNISRISDLHSRILNSTDENTNHKNEEILEDLVGQTRELGNSIKSRIQSLEAQPAQPGQDMRIRKNRTDFARSKFVEALQNYQQVERDYRARYKQRVERQFRIVKPDATQDEINVVVNDTSGGGDQIFAQALTSSNRYGEARIAYREVQDRHADIQRIERTLEELAQLFNDMSVLINQQDETINAIETQAARVEDDTRGGLEQTEKAVEHARSARRKRWICFFITLIILAIIGIAVGVSVGKSH
ncbi:t-SNARE [Phanerochaete sordida]|uniref:t-SNARE n=1 Tax=Phanerochaete sordida TaxID=48140 RepID=A0A9P3L9E8_9APHY|nr:t-SNARE [Phanerochaete sordida]